MIVEHCSMVEPRSQRSDLGPQSLLLYTDIALRRSGDASKQEDEKVGQKNPNPETESIGRLFVSYSSGNTLPRLQTQRKLFGVRS